MNRVEFLDLAADYLNGLLSETDQARFQAYLDEHPTAQHDLANLQVIRSCLEFEIERETGSAWAVMQTRLHQENKPPPIKKK